MDDQKPDLKNSQSDNAAAAGAATEHAACEAKCQEYLAGWKRSQADFINYKKNEAKRFTEAAAFSSKELVKDILPALDSFAALIKHLEGARSDSETRRENCPMAARRRQESPPV